MRTTRKIKLAALVLVLCSCFLFYCRKEKVQQTHTPGAPDSTSTSFPVKTVNIVNYAFTPFEVIIMRQTSVSWNNRDSVSHTVTSFSGAFDSGEIKPGTNFFFTFKNAGTYDYYCRYHREPGKVTVQ